MAEDELTTGPLAVLVVAELVAVELVPTELVVDKPIEEGVDVLLDAVVEVVCVLLVAPRLVLAEVVVG